MPRKKTKKPLTEAQQRGVIVRRRKGWISKEGRSKIAAAQRRRWKAYRAAKKAA